MRFMPPPSLPKYPQAVYPEWGGWGEFLGLPESKAEVDDWGRQTYLRAGAKYVKVQPLPEHVKPGTADYARGGYDCFCGEHGLFVYMG